MRLRSLIFGVLLAATSISAQIPVPQLNLSGNIGCQGFPCVNSGTLVFTSDANHVMTVQETSAFYLRVTSSVSLTATRNLIAPLGRFPFTIENATAGGQSIQIIGQSGTGVIIPNGSTVGVWNDSINFVQIGSGSISITVGSTTIAGATNGYLLFNNAGTLGQKPPNYASPVFAFTSDDLGTGTTGYALFSGNSTMGATELTQQITAPIPCSVNNLRVKLVGGSIGASDTVSITLRSNSSNTSLACTVPNNGSSCLDLSHSANIVASDLIDWQISPSIGLTVSGNISISATWQCSI